MTHFDQRDFCTALALLALLIKKQMPIPTEEEEICDPCGQCHGTPRIVRCLHLNPKESRFSFFAVCGCKAGMPAHSRHAAVVNWWIGRYYGESLNNVNCNHYNM